MDGISQADGQPNLAGQRAVYLYRVLRKYRKRGRGTDSQNHAGAFLNDEAMLAVSAYYANLPPASAAAEDDPGEESASFESDPFCGYSRRHDAVHQMP